MYAAIQEERVSHGGMTGYLIGVGSIAADKEGGGGMIKKTRGLMSREGYCRLIFLGIFILVFLWPTVWSEAQQASKSGREQELARLIEGAKAEGKVIWWDGLRPEETQPVIEAFQKKYPFLKVEHTRIRGTESRERILRELMTGIVSFDVFDIGGEEIPTFQKAGLLEKFDWAKAFDIRPEQVDPGGSMVIIGSHIFGPAYNTKLVKPEDVPKSWEDLLNSKWIGKMVVDTRPKAFVGLIPAWGEERVLDFVKKLVTYKPQFRRGQTEALQLMAAGEFPLHSGSQYDSVYNIKQKGGPLEFLAFEPVPTDLEEEGVPKKAAHPNAAKLLLGFVATEGQEIYDKHSGRGIPFPGYSSTTSKRFGPMKKSVMTPEWVLREEELSSRVRKAMGKE